jgi:hypothetical protein
MGCAPYGNSPGRDYDEKTEAHSTLAIAGKEQAPIADEWRWSHTVIPSVRRWISEDTHDFFYGEHEGYYEYPSAMTLHARKVFFVKSAPSYWVVLDWVESVPENDYRVYFHGCVPGTITGNTVMLGEGPVLAVIPPADDVLALQREQSDGLAAYCREKNLDPEKYPCFVYSKHAASDCFVWVLMPGAAAGALPDVHRLPVRINGIDEDAHGATAVEITFPDHTDTLCVSHKDFDVEMHFGALQSWGWLAFRRIAIDGTVMLAINHTMADGACGR